MKIEITKEIMDDIHKVVNYLYDHEYRHYRECENPEKHIFLCIERIRLFLEGEASDLLYSKETTL
jgi:hypothetical protein